MAKYGPSSVSFFLVSGYNLAGVTSDMTYKKTGGAEETQALGDSWAESIPTGRMSAELSQNGWFDDASKSSVDALIGIAGTTSRVICVAPAGGTAGKAFTGFEGAFSTEVERLVEKDGLAKLNCTYTVSGAVEEGAIIEALTAQTASGNSSSVDNSASSASGGSGYIQVTAESGSSPTMAVKIQHSADDSSFADLITFTTASTVSAERKTVSGTVNRYLRINRTIGGSSSPSVTYVVGFSRG
jgi:hypothetical protein|tara:strand:- start:4148 stop:4873 length:726 start_codon:yes stop_codon:yes gene_type:complete